MLLLTSSGDFRQINLIQKVSRRPIVIEWIVEKQPLISMVSRWFLDSKNIGSNGFPMDFGPKTIASNGFSMVFGHQNHW